MLGEKIRSLFRPLGEPLPDGSQGIVPNLGRPIRAFPGVEAQPERQSNGLRQFFENLPRGMRLRILDLGGASQANVDFITFQGHTIYTQDLLLDLERLSAPAPGSGGLAARLIQENLSFAAGQFDGILVWDTLEFLDEEILRAAVGRMHVILKSGGTLLTYFHTHAKGEPVPVYRYQILDYQTLDLRLRFSRRLPRAFNTRNLERLFGNFHSVKFFLAKDGLREVIVTR